MDYWLDGIRISMIQSSNNPLFHSAKHENVNILNEVMCLVLEVIRFVLFQEIYGQSNEANSKTVVCKAIKFFILYNF